MSEKFDVFISHSSNDRHIAYAVCNALERLRIRCWIAPRNITPGDRWEEAVLKGIDNSKIFLIIYSKHSKASDMVVRELRRAANKKKSTIIPLRIEDTPLEGVMDFYLSERHWMDALTEPREKEIRDFAELVLRMLPERQEELENFEEAPKKDGNQSSQDSKGKIRDSFLNSADFNEDEERRIAEEVERRLYARSSEGKKGELHRSSNFSFLKRFKHNVKDKLERISKEHIIVYGYNKMAKILIDHLRKDYSISVMCEKFSNDEKNDLFSRGILFHERYGDDDAWFKKSGVLRANYIILFQDDDTLNLELLLSLNNYWSSLNVEQVLQVIVHLSHPKSFELYDSMIDTENRFLKSRTFSFYQLVGDKLLNDHPLYIGYEEQLKKTDGAPLNLLFIGFGKINQQIAFQAMNLSHFLSDKKINMTIFEEDIDKAQKEFFYLCRGQQNKVANIMFMNVEMNNVSIAKEINQMKNSFTHVFHSYETDQFNMVEWLDFMEGLPEIRFFIDLKDHPSISNWIGRNLREYAHIHSYPSFQEVLNSDYVLYAKLNEMAKVAYETAQKRRQTLGNVPFISWNELSSFHQESNRYQLLHNDTKLMLLGLKKTPLRDVNYTNQLLTPEEFQHLIQPYLELLAKVEHERWNTFHFLRGWTQAENPNGGRRDMLETKQHRFLLPWEELPESIKDYDRQVILELQEFYQSQEYGLIKI